MAGNANKPLVLFTALHALVVVSEVVAESTRLTLSAHATSKPVAVPNALSTAVEAGLSEAFTSDTDALYVAGRAAGTAAPEARSLASPGLTNATGSTDMNCPSTALSSLLPSARVTVLLLNAGAGAGAEADSADEEVPAADDDELDDSDEADPDRIIVPL